MKEYLTQQDIDQAVSAVHKLTAQEPRIGMILGSGLGTLAETVTNPEYVNYDQIPGWPVSTVEGHVGRLVFGELEGQNVVVMQGRTHFYEGYPITTLGLPVRVMQQLGIEMFFVTNAAGAVNPEFEPGDLMLLTDHLNLLGMAGHNPLRGPNLDDLGPRFPDMSRVYDRDLQKLALEVSAKEKLNIQQGVYVCLAGPTFETPTDLRFLRGAGVDAVGMSTVPEAIVARHGGTRVMGVSGISNKANLDGNTETTHQEVLEAGQILVPKLTKLIRGVLKSI
jgi:purine-nucleoside phosphorylase